MESFSDDILAEIFVRLSVRNNAALVCRKWYEVDRVLRRELLTGRGLCPPESALAALCSRFCNLSTINISYLGWMSHMGKQVDDASLQILSASCANLSDLSLNFCTFITDVGMANLTCCQKLKAVRLNFTPCVSGRGLLSLVSGCHSLTLLHINRLMNVRVLEWLQFIGKNRRIESLGIRNCKGVEEVELARLGRRGWQNLREFFYEVDVVHRPTGDFFGHNGRGASLLNGWRFDDPQQAEFCLNLQMVSITNCLAMSGTGVLWLLSRCRSLRVLQIDTCVGVQDEDVLVLAKNCSQISSISLRISCHFPNFNFPPRLTDLALLGIAQHCHLLETMVLAFADGDFVPTFTGAGIVTIVQGCTRLRILSLDRAYFFTDSAMQAVCQSASLQVLELNKCHKVTDDGLRMVARSNLRELKVCRCFGLTDVWLTPLKASRALAYLSVEDCPQISHESVLNSARVVSYKCTYQKMVVDALVSLEVALLLQGVQMHWGVNFIPFPGVGYRWLCSTFGLHPLRPFKCLNLNPSEFGLCRCYTEHQLKSLKRSTRSAVVGLRSQLYMQFLGC